MSASRFFDAVARRYDRQYALSGELSRERIARVLFELEGRAQILVLGIGTGRELPALLDAGHDVVGVDVSEAMIAECNRRSRTAPIVLADFWDPLPFADRSFDGAIALHGTIAHPPAEGAFVRLSSELARVLVPDGLFVAEVPAAEGLARLAAASDTLAITGPTSFVHRDRTSGESIAGVALTAEGWRSALSPALDVRVEPLGEVEHLVVAEPRHRAAGTAPGDRRSARLGSV